MGTIARGQISFVDLNDGKSLNLFLSSNQPLTQLHNADADVATEHAKYTPDYTVNNLVITPELYVSGSQSSRMDRVLSTPVWTIDGAPVAGMSGVTVGTKAQSYRLTIANNIANPTMRVECTVTYTDEYTGAESVAKASITYTKLDTAGEMIRAIMYAPDGTIFKKSTDAGINLTTLKLHCDMWRGTGIDSTNVTYEWYRHDNTTGRDSGSWIKITASNAGNITGYTTNEISITADDILNYDVFKCVCTDTDTKSSTPGDTCSDIMSVIDMTDPYTIEFETPAGTTLTSGMTSTTTKVYLWQDGERIPDESAFYASLTYNWTKYKKDGTVDTTAKYADASGSTDSRWSNGSASIAGASGRSVTVFRNEIQVAATYAVEIVETAG